MSEGKVRKYLEENTLIHQKYVLDESKKIKEVLGGATVKTFVRYTLGGLSSRTIQNFAGRLGVPFFCFP